MAEHTRVWIVDDDEAIRFVLSNPHVDSMVVGGLNATHMRANIATASEVRAARAA